MIDLTEDGRMFLGWAICDALNDEQLLKLARSLNLDTSPEAIRKEFWNPCDDCQDDVGARGEWFMVHNHVWEEASGKRFLCVRCMETRLGRPLTPDDFTDAPCNVPNMSLLLLDRLGYR